MTTTNFCILCKHFRPDRAFSSRAQSIRFGGCAHPSLIAFDPVSGEPTHKVARVERERGQLCGKDARLFEAAVHGQQQQQTPDTWPHGRESWVLRAISWAVAVDRKG
jgi:hypothetical protein